ncbi:hypothetical protein GMORB2_2531 [Geosmithia morbida]|uniref:Uncharacterized protein n=1 Tax=Geosmithia morbida TaxID=1094350 RepID=A0A9P4YS35_9HYPO|nr:uncharacterized protein GMORB2_2531 [Geosmithia morbida]KAF4121045.1 hypothetical protein GMORB2_2531 [Geosmithia morbida]
MLLPVACPRPAPLLKLAVTDGHGSCTEGDAAYITARSATACYACYAVIGYSAHLPSLPSLLDEHGPPTSRQYGSPPRPCRTNL